MGSFQGVSYLNNRSDNAHPRWKKYICDPLVANPPMEVFVLYVCFSIVHHCSKDNSVEGAVILQVCN